MLSLMEIGNTEMGVGLRSEVKSCLDYVKFKSVSSFEEQMIG